MMDAVDNSVCLDKGLEDISEKAIQAENMTLLAMTEYPPKVRWLFF